MSYTPSKNLLSTTGVALLGSLGIHGLLWVVLPGLTIDSQTDKSPAQRTIGLVDLSPQEQSRLPQVPSPADNNLPPFASQLTELPPLPPAPPYQTSVIPPLQLPPGSAPIYNNIPYQSSVPPQTFRVPLPPPPSNTSFPPIPYENLPSSPNNYPLPSPPQAPPFVLPSNNGLPNIPLSPDRSLPAEDVATATPAPAPAPAPPTQNPDTSTLNPPTEANKLPERGKQELLAMRESMRNNFPPTTATPPSANTTSSMSRQEIVTALRGNRSNPATPSANTTSSMSRQEIVTALRGNRNPSNELSEDTKIALDNLEKFKQQQAAIQAQNPDVVTKPPIRRKLTTCDRAIDGDIAVVGVVVNPEGKRLSEPNLITKKGKPDITQAQNYVRDYEFAKTGKTTNYNFRLEFDYVARKCTQAKPTPAPTTNTIEPTPTPTTTDTAEPTPRLAPSSSRPIPTFRPTPSNSRPIPTFRSAPINSTPTSTPSPDSVTPPPEPTVTPQISPPPSNSQRPKDLF